MRDSENPLRAASTVAELLREAYYPD